MLEANPEDVEFKDGEFIVSKSNKKKTIGEVAEILELKSKK